MRLSPVLLLALGCTGKVVENDPPSDDSNTDTVELTCETDEDCGTTEICEEGECITGDRDNSFEEATPLRQNEPIEGVIAPEGDIDTFES